MISTCFNKLGKNLRKVLKIKSNNNIMRSWENINLLMKPRFEKEKEWDLEEIGNKEIEEGSIKGIIMEGEIVSKEWMKEIGEEIGMIDLLIVIGLIRDLITIHEIEIITEIGIMIISNLIIKKGQGKKEEMMMFKLIIWVLSAEDQKPQKLQIAKEKENFQHQYVHSNPQYVTKTTKTMMRNQVFHSFST